MASKKTAPPSTARGTGKSNLLVTRDYAEDGDGSVFFRVETQIPRTENNAAAFDRFVRQLGRAEKSSRVEQEMAKFLLEEVEKLGTGMTDQTNAKNMFLAALGLPALP